MSAESDLKKDGIKIVKQLDTLMVNSIATNISNKICITFPNYNLNKNKLFIKLSRLNMYMATMPSGLAEANYFYKNSSIYFNSNISSADLEEFAIHECIHCIQEVKDKKNFLIRMGLCDYTEFKIYGLALNEAAVQLMSSKIISIPKDYVKYFDLHFETISPSYYPLECCLVNQMAYITGEDVLFESTINSNDTFKNKFISLTSKKVFFTLQDYFDKLLYDEEKLIQLTNKLAELQDTNKKSKKILDKMQILRKKITITFLKAQNLIITSYFNKLFNNLTSSADIENYRKRLYGFKDFLALTDDYTFFNDYYVSKMEDISQKQL